MPARPDWFQQSFARPRSDDRYPRNRFGRAASTVCGCARAACARVCKALRGEFVAAAAGFALDLDEAHHPFCKIRLFHNVVNETPRAVSESTIRVSEPVSFVLFYDIGIDPFGRGDVGISAGLIAV
jgi:hypothetical protein